MHTYLYVYISICIHICIHVYVILHCHIVLYCTASGGLPQLPALNRLTIVMNYKSTTYELKHY